MTDTATEEIRDRYRRSGVADDKGCGCKHAGGAVTKALPAAVARALEAGVVSADVAHLVPRGLSGGEALQHLRDLAASADAGGGGGAAGAPVRGELGVTNRGSSGGLTPALVAVDAGRCQLQGRGLGRMGGGGK
jgi:hypothetical protein